jgi:gamma-glutamyl-gamma-aminobutyrate hydrolase PuuD
VAVQWHAECLVGRPRHASLFDAFVSAAARYERAGAAVSRAA